MTRDEFAIMFHEMPSNQLLLCGDKTRYIQEVILAHRELYDTQITIPLLIIGYLSDVGSTSSKLVGFSIDHYNSISYSTGQVEQYLERMANNMIEHGLRCENCTLFIHSIEKANAYIIDKISDAFKKVGNPDMPFGGCKVIAAGDFINLNPLLTGYENELLKYPSPHFFSANVFPLRGYRLDTGTFDPEYSSKYNQFFECVINIWQGIRVKSNLNKVNKLFY